MWEDDVKDEDEDERAVIGGFRNLNSFWVVPVCCESLKHVSRVCAGIPLWNTSDRSSTTCRLNKIPSDSDCQMQCIRLWVETRLAAKW